MVSQTKKVLFSTPVLYALMIGLGILSGLSDIAWLKELGVLVSDIFIKLFKCISLPIISLSIIVTLANYNKSDGFMKRIWQRTMLYTFSTTLIAATISCVLYVIIQPSSVAVQLNSNPIAESSLGYLGYLANLVPTNLLSPFLEQQVMAALLLSILVGFAVRQIPEDEPRRVITLFFRGAQGIFLVMTRWIITLIPLALFGFITSTVIQLRAGNDVKGLRSGWYFIANLR